MYVQRLPRPRRNDALRSRGCGKTAARIRRRAGAWPLAVWAIALVAVSCGEESGVGPVDPPNESNDRIDITNDAGALGGRMSRPNTPVTIEPPATTQIAYTAPSRAVTLTLIAEVLPPTVDGEVVQATSVAIVGADKAMVSYNMRGAPRLGAVDWITELKSNPRIDASATFNDSDISALSWDDTYVYAAEATDAAGFPFPAVFERLKLVNDKFTLQDNMRVPLTSFAATGSMRTSNEIYATSGDNGHVFAFDKSSFSLLGQFPLDDARWAVWDQDGQRVVVAQGTPGRISVFAEGEFPGGSMNLLNTFPFPGADVPESKSTAVIAGGKAFIAAGPEGVQIMCLDDGQIVGSVPRPDPASLGLDPSVVVTNAVTVAKDLMFISNGEAGVWVARGSQVFKDTACTDPQQITMLGRLVFDNLQSVNHVELDNDLLIIAAGLGGVKVVAVGGQ